MLTEGPKSQAENEIRRWIESLTPTQLREWIFLRLHGRDCLVSGDRNGVSWGLIEDLYRDLGGKVASAIARSVCDFVEELSDPADTTWQGESVHGLLLVAGEVARAGAIPAILRIVNQRRFGEAASPDSPDIDLHYRALQALVSSNFRGTPEFWLAQALLEDGRFAVVSFDGLALSSPQGAIELLTRIPCSTRLILHLDFALVFMIEDHGADVVLPLIAEFLPEMPQETQTLVLNILEGEGIEVE